MPQSATLFEAGKNIHAIAGYHLSGVDITKFEKALTPQENILWEKLKNNEIVTGKITNLTKGGALVNVLGIKGFIPTSQLENQVQIGEELELKILSIDASANNFIFSNKKIYEDELEIIKKDTLEKIELNMVVKGNVVRLTDFGAFVDIGGIDGLLPLSQMSWSWIDKPSDLLKQGDAIEVEIIGIDTEKQRISLSLKSLVENPWEKASEIIKEKEIMKGKITAIKPFGAFVEICPKIEGLINKAQIKEYFKKYQKNLEIDDEIEVLIKRFDVENQKINLEIV